MGLLRGLGGRNVGRRGDGLSGGLFLGLVQAWPRRLGVGSGPQRGRWPRQGKGKGSRLVRAKEADAWSRTTTHPASLPFGYPESGLSSRPVSTLSLSRVRSNARLSGSGRPYPANLANLGIIVFEPALPRLLPPANSTTQLLPPVFHHPDCHYR